MTRTAIKNAFAKMDSTEQAIVLKDLAAALAESLTEEDQLDARVFDRRKAEEFKARPWSKVREVVDARHAKRRSPNP